jgi:hypothetical protein
MMLVTNIPTNAFNIASPLLVYRASYVSISDMAMASITLIIHLRKEEVIRGSLHNFGILKCRRRFATHG